jgi:cobalt-precorrin-5B (C1)-methyltransferase
VTIAGGVAKMTKLAQGRLDLHAKRGVVDLEALAQVAQDVGGAPALAEAITHANTAAQAFQMAASDGVALGDAIAEQAWRTAATVLRGADIELETLLFDREGVLVGRTAFAPVHV